MESDGLSDLLDEAFPRCPFCGEPLEAVGALERPYLHCDYCGLSFIS